MGIVDSLFAATLLFFAWAPHAGEATLSNDCQLDAAEPNDSADQATPLTFGTSARLTASPFFFMKCLLTFTPLFLCL
jgi:hypothetical protein